MAIIQNKALLHSAPRNPGFLLVAIIEAIRAAEQRKDNTA
jgi:predicted alternative tryptophan synthase beta-subunit